MKLDNYLNHKFQARQTRRQKPDKLKEEKLQKGIDAYEEISKKAAEISKKSFEATINTLMGDPEWAPNYTTTYAFPQPVIHTSGVTQEIIHEPLENDSISSIISGISEKGLLEVLKTQWKYMNNATFTHILEKIGYPQPFPHIDNITNITYVDNILEIIEGEKPNEVDEYNVPRHGVHEPGSKKSNAPINPAEKPGRVYGDLSKGIFTKPRPKKPSDIVEEMLGGGSQFEDRPLGSI